MALGKSVFAGQAKSHKERNLRVRTGVEGRRVGAVSLGLLSLRHHLFDLRCGSGFSVALCGGIHGIERGSLRSHAGFCAFAGRRLGLGMGKGNFDVGVIRRGRVRTSLQLSAF